MDKNYESKEFFTAIGYINTVKEPLASGFYKVRDHLNFEIIDYFYSCDNINNIKKQYIKSGFFHGKAYTIESFLDYEEIDIVGTDSDNVSLLYSMSNNRLLYMYLNKNDDNLYLVPMPNEKDRIVNLSNPIKITNIRNVDVNKNMKFYKDILRDSNEYLNVVVKNFISDSNNKIYNGEKFNHNYFICKYKKIGKKFIVSTSMFNNIKSKYKIENIELNGKVCIKHYNLQSYKFNNVFSLTNDEIISSISPYMFNVTIIEYVSDEDYNNFRDHEQSTFIIIPNKYYKAIVADIYKIVDAKKVDCKLLDEKSLYMFYLNVIITLNGDIAILYDNKSDCNFYKHNERTKKYFKYSNDILNSNIYDISDANINNHYLNGTEFKNAEINILTAKDIYDKISPMVKCNNGVNLMDIIVSFMVGNNNVIKETVNKYFPEYNLVEPSITLINDNDKYVTNILGLNGIIPDDSNKNVVTVCDNIPKYDNSIYMKVMKKHIKIKNNRNVKKETKIINSK